MSLPSLSISPCLYCLSVSVCLSLSQFPLGVCLYLGLSLCVHAHVTLSLYRFPPRLTTIRGFLQLSMAQQGRSPRSSFQSCWAGPGNLVQGSGCLCSPSSLLSLSCWQSVSWWWSTLGQSCTKAMPLSPQSHHPQSRRAASTSSAGACWTIRTVTKTPIRNLPALTPTLCQMGPGSASMKSRFCRRETGKLASAVSEQETGQSSAC